MKHKEASSQTVLNSYLREKAKQGFYCRGELKEVKGNTFNFSKIETNQDEGLPALENNGLVWKFSDEDSRQKPCDFESSPPLPSYLVLKFKKTFYFIRYKYITDLKMNGIKSIDEDHCKKVAERLFHI